LEHQFLQADGSHSTGCFDLTCPGFIQTSNEIALGAAIYPISIPGCNTPFFFSQKGHYFFFIFFLFQLTLKVRIIVFFK
jgi:hypothetical protein